MAIEKQPLEILLRDLLIAQRDSQIIALGIAGVPQLDIREIVGVDIHRVSRIVKLLKKSKKEAS